MRGNIGKLIAGLVIVIVLAIIFMRGDDLVKLVDTIQKGAPLFLVLAVIAQMGKYVLQGFAFKYCFHAVEESISFRTGFALVFGTFFVNTIAPSLNLAGTSLVMDTAVRHKIPAGKGTSAALLMQLSIDTGFVLIMLTTFGVLSLTVGLQPGWFLLGLAAVLLVGGLVTVMTVGGLKPDLVIRILRPFVHLADKILAKFKKGPVDEWMEETIHSFSKAAGSLVKTPKKTAIPFLFSLGASACEIGCFALTGVAFGIHSPQALICGYVVATLFAMISFTPQGVGVVEAAVMVAFGLFGINSASGLAVVLVYRSIVFWMPFLIGAVVIQRMGMSAGKKKASGKRIKYHEAAKHHEKLQARKAAKGAMPAVAASAAEAAAAESASGVSAVATMEQALPETAEAVAGTAQSAQAVRDAQRSHDGEIIAARGHAGGPAAVKAHDPQSEEQGGASEK